MQRFAKKIGFICLAVVAAMAIQVAVRNHRESAFQRQLAGVWKSESATATYRTDGTFHTTYRVHKTNLTQELNYEGNWKLSNDFLALTLTHFSNSLPDTNEVKIGTVILYKIEGMDDQRLLLKLPPYTGDRVYVMERE